MDFEKQEMKGTDMNEWRILQIGLMRATDTRIMIKY